MKTAENVEDFKDFLDTIDKPYYEFYSILSRKYCQKEKGIIELPNFLTDYRKKLYNNINIDSTILKTILILCDFDQSFREKEEDFWKVQYVDFINHCALKEIINKIGKIPSIYEIGEDSDNMILLLSHIGDTAFFNFIYPYLIKQTKEGEFKPNNTAYIFDYHWHACHFNFIDSTKYISYQKYGTLDVSLDEKMKILIPVKDIEETNRLRLEIGLESLEDYLKDNPDIIYDKDLFIKTFPQFQE